MSRLGVRGLLHLLQRVPDHLAQRGALTGQGRDLDSTVNDGSSPCAFAARPNRLLDRRRHAQNMYVVCEGGKIDRNRSTAAPRRPRSPNLSAFAAVPKLFLLSDRLRVLH